MRPDPFIYSPDGRGAIRLDACSTCETGTSPGSTTTVSGAWPAEVGEVLEWEMPGGLRRLRVQRILFQPEASGRFDL
jgi:hypothetical protein